MAEPRREFLESTKREALRRQRFVCGACLESITDIGEKGAAQHRFGEGAQAHHVYPDNAGGPPTLQNCIILCRACHLNAHQGGGWTRIKVPGGKTKSISLCADISIYDDLKDLPMNERIAKIAALYPHYECRTPCELHKPEKP